MDFAVRADHCLRLKEREKSERYIDLVGELKNTKEYEGDSDTNRNWCAWNNHSKDR